MNVGSAGAAAKLAFRDSCCDFGISSSTMALTPVAAAADCGHRVLLTGTAEFVYVVLVLTSFPWEHRCAVEECFLNCIQLELLATI
jgi:hypothetical protein